MIGIGDLRRELFTDCDSSWNAWVRDATAKLETKDGLVERRLLMEKIIRLAKNQMLVIEMMKEWA